MAKALFNKEFEPVAAPGPADRRFKDEAWAENVVFDCIKQCYLLTSRHLQSAVGRVEGLDDHTTKKVQFYTRQFIDAMSPTNFLWSNPAALRRPTSRRPIPKSSRRPSKARARTCLRASRT